MALTNKQIETKVKALHKGKEVTAVVVNPGRVSVYLEDGSRVAHRLSDLDKKPAAATPADLED